MESRLVAVLEIGSTGIRLIVAQLLDGGQWEEKTRAEWPVALGRDVFSTGELSRESLIECLSVLRNFRELLSGWGIAPGEARCIATSALRVARNRDIFADRVRRETGFALTVVEGLEENRLMYLGARFALRQDLPLFWRANSMILEMGGGSTEVMLLRQGRMAAAHSIKLGTIHIDRRMRLRAGPGLFSERYLRDAVRNTMGLLNADMDMAGVRALAIAGADARLAASHVGSRLNDHCRVIARGDFIAFADKIRGYSIDDCIKALGMSYSDAEGFVSGILALRLFLEQTKAEQIAVLLVSIREGCLIDLAQQGADPELQEDFRSQIIASAASLGKKHGYDEEHALHVARLCMALFDALPEEQHGMGARQRMMLEAAAILHDVGTVISPSGHHRHGHYIVSNSDIFGLARSELDAIAGAVRYHRGEAPSEADPEFAALARGERILVLKMASILRVADALDRGHAQKIKKLSVERRSSTLALHAGGAYDISLELLSLEEKADLFQDVFGYKVVLS